MWPAPGLHTWLTASVASKWASLVCCRGRVGSAQSTAACHRKAPNVAELLSVIICPPGAQTVGICSERVARMCAFQTVVGAVSAAGRPAGLGLAAPLLICIKVYVGYLGRAQACRYTLGLEPGSGSLTMQLGLKAWPGQRGPPL